MNHQLMGVAPADLGFAAAVIAVVGGLVGLITALINNRTARKPGKVGGPEAPSPSPSQPIPVLGPLPGRVHLVNRDAEMREAVARVRAGETTLAIEGPLGVGKTAVAIELVHRLLGRAGGRRGALLSGHAFVWIDGRDRDVGLVDICRHLALTTGDQSLTTTPAKDKLEVLQLHLSRHKTVVFLDNLRVVDGSRPDSVRRLIKSVPAGSRVIAAVDRPGTVQGARLSLKGLDRDHAREKVAYEVGRLGLGKAIFGPEFADRLYGFVGGNPRMIQWSLRTLRDGSQTIDEHFETIARGEGLASMFAPLWSELTGQARAALAACAVLKGEASGKQIAIMSGLAPDELTAALDELVAGGLLTTMRTAGQPNSYNCAPALARFVRSETPEATIGPSVRRLAEHYLQRFRANWEDAPGAIPHVAALPAILEELFAMSDDETLQALVWAVHDIYFTLGLFDDRIAAGELAYRSAMIAENYRAASRSCSMMANTHAIRGEEQQARAAFSLGTAAAARSGDPGEIARQRRCDGFLSYRSGDAKLALAAIDGAEALALEGRNDNSVVDILDLRSAACWYLGSIDETEAAATGSLATCERLGWRRAVAYPLRYLAEVAIQRAAYGEAEQHLERARCASVEHEDRRQLARLDLTAARMHLLRGDARAARSSAARAETQARSLGLPPEAREARAWRIAAARARVIPPVRRYYQRRRPMRLTDAPVGGD